MKRFWQAGGFVLALFLAGTCVGKELGEMAAPLKISKWVKGEKVDLESGRGKNVYVVEFWATWCPPCRTSIPHLTKLQNLSGDGVVFVGVTAEEARVVEPFVEKMGDKMEYVVAVDDDGQTSKAYMSAYGVRGIPHAFVVNKEGKIAWHGHPMGDLSKVLAQVLSGTFDIDKAKKAQKANQLAEEYLSMARAGKRARIWTRKGTRWWRTVPGSPDMLNDFAWNILTSPGIKTRDLKLALRAAKAAYEGTEGKSPAVTDTYARALFDTGKTEEAIKLQKEAVEAATTDEERKQYEKTLQGYEKKARK